MPDSLQTVVSNVSEGDPPDHSVRMTETQSTELMIDQRHPDWEDVFPALKQDLIALTDMTVDRIRPDHKDYEVSLVLENDEAIQRLNARYRHKAKPTNVLSFPQIEFFSDIAMMPEPVLLGDIIMALETIQREAKEQSKPVAQHVRHLFVHGLLHLLGYDHQTESEAQEMEALEIEILNIFGDPSPYETPVQS